MSDNLLPIRGSMSEAEIDSLQKDWQEAHRGAPRYEQRLITLVGGPLHGRMEAWVADQTSRIVTRWSYGPGMPVYEYRYGFYVEGPGGEAHWHGPRRKVPWRQFLRDMLT